MYYLNYKNGIVSIESKSKYEQTNVDKLVGAYQDKKKLQISANINDYIQGQLDKEKRHFLEVREHYKNMPEELDTSTYDYRYEVENEIFGESDVVDNLLEILDLKDYDCTNLRGDQHDYVSFVCDYLCIN